MPTAQIEFHHRHKSLNGIVDLRHRKESFWMRHETANSHYLGNPKKGEEMILRNSF